MDRHVYIHVAMVVIVTKSQEYVVAQRDSQELIAPNVWMGIMALSVLFPVPQDVKMTDAPKLTERALAKQISS